MQNSTFCICQAANVSTERKITWPSALHTFCFLLTFDN